MVSEDDVSAEIERCSVKELGLYEQCSESFASLTCSSVTSWMGTSVPVSLREKS